MGDEETVDLHHAGLLDADSIPNENQSHECFSCGEKMTGVYCYACGNKNDNYRRSIWSLAGELFASLTALEGRIWRSLRSLILKPGQMAREYADGARQRWTSPVRMYLATSLLLFGYVALSQTQLVAFGPKFKTNDTVVSSGEDFHFSPKIYFLERKSKIRELIPDETIAAFEKDIANIINDDSEKSIENLERELVSVRDGMARLDDQMAAAANAYAKAGMMRGRESLQAREQEIMALIAARKSEPIADETESVPESVADTDVDATNINSEKDDDSSYTIIGMPGETFELGADELRKVISIAIRQPELINRPISKYLSQFMFFMMPFSMLMGAIFIRGRERAMLYDHLVHAAYIHAFSFLLLFVFILLVQFTPIKGLIWVYTLILLVYLPLSAKRMFGRGWFKTFLTSYGVGVIYTFIMILILTVLITMGLIDIAKGVAQWT